MKTIIIDFHGYKGPSLTGAGSLDLSVQKLLNNLYPPKDIETYLNLERDFGIEVFCNRLSQTLKNMGVTVEHYQLPCNRGIIDPNRINDGYQSAVRDIIPASETGLIKALSNQAAVLKENLFSWLQDFPKDTMVIIPHSMAQNDPSPFKSSIYQDLKGYNQSWITPSNSVRKNALINATDEGGTMGNINLYKALENSFTDLKLPFAWNEIYLNNPNYTDYKVMDSFKNSVFFELRKDFLATNTR